MSTHRRLHMDCMPGDCLVGMDPDDCPVPNDIREESLEPKRISWDNPQWRAESSPDNPVMSAKSVRSGYANLVRAINRVNKTLPSGEHFCVPFSVQEAVITYIEEREAIESLTMPKEATS